ncbi:MAG: response regulator [Planctomycetota bacterium]
MARILVADDEPPMRMVIRHACERAGHEVHEAIDAPTAIAAYERLKPDLLVLDIGMPGGGGRFVLNTLRFGGTKRIAPVLVVTGSMAGTVDEIRRTLGVEAVILKPFRIVELVRVVQELLAKPAAPAAPSSNEAPPQG